jgi:hypothetical protein
MKYTPTQQKEHRDKLLEFMIALPERNFNITTWKQDILEDVDTSVSPLVKNCNTVCCALGWCPTLFPDDWEWSHLSPTLICNRSRPYYYCAFDESESFFGVFEIFFESHYVDYSPVDPQQEILKEDFIKALREADAKITSK